MTQIRNQRQSFASSPHPVHHGEEEPKHTYAHVNRYPTKLPHTSPKKQEFSVCISSPHATVSYGAVGKHRFTMDEQESIGGTDQGPNPLEYSLAALIGCESITARQIAQERGLEILNINMSAKGWLDPRGFLGVANARRHFDAVKLVAKIETSASKSELKALESEVERRCPIFNLFQAADVKMDASWERVEHVPSEGKDEN